MEYNVTEGKVYLITAKTTTTVTDSGYVLRIVAANSQGVVVAISNKLEIVGECDVRPFDVATRTHLELFLSACGITLDSASAQIAEWRSYLPMIQEQVDEETARQISEEFERAAVEYLVDPTATKVWNTNSDGVSVLESTTCPYAVNPPTVPVVDFNVITCAANSISVPCFAKKTNVGIFLPSATRTSVCLCQRDFNSFFFAPKSEFWQYCFWKCTYYNQPTLMFSANNASSAFLNTAMSAENISKTLDSLPTWTDGKSHVITFTGSTGAVHVSTTETITVEVNGQTYSYDNFPRFTTDDEKQTLRYAVARATAKGWEVQMGDPQQ